MLYIYRWTLKRRVSNFRIFKRRALKDDMTRKQKARRVEWCREHRGTNFAFLRFSDVSSFEVAELRIPRRKNVYLTKLEKHRPACIVRGGVRIRRSIMVWGVFSRAGPVAFRILFRYIKSQHYSKTLRDELLPHLDELPLKQLRHVVFQHDNGPPHRAVCTRLFLDNNGAQTAYWPPLSPHLNPIEFVWAAMKERISRRRPNSFAAVLLEIRIAWRAVMTTEFCRNIYNHLTSAISTVITHKRLR